MQQEFQDILRYHINRFIFDHGFGPTTLELALKTQTSEAEVKNGLDQLVASHAIVLHPNSHRIWVAHPYALFPTMFWVETDLRSWYGNCIWCSFGIAALAEGDAQIYTKLNGTIEPLTIHIRNGQVQESELVVHFPISARQFWDNVIFTCANMFAFDSEQAIEDWCKHHRVPKGEVKPIADVWELAQHWYGNYLSPTWTRKSAAEAGQIFQEVGFTSDFWKLQ